MNGNVTAKFDWLSLCGPQSATGEVCRQPRLLLDSSHIHLSGGRDELALFFLSFFFFSSPRFPRYGSRAWTSWLRGDRGSPPESMAAGIALESGGDTETCQRWWKGNKETQVLKWSVRTGWVGAASWGGLLHEKLRPQFIVGAKPAFFQRPRWSKFVFLWCTEKGELSRWKPARSTPSDDIFLPACAHFGQLRSSHARVAVSVWPAWGNFYNEIHLGAPSLCALP